MNQTFDVRAALAKAQADEDWPLVKRLIKQLENESNERTIKRERRIAERRFTGEPITTFGELNGN